MCPECNREYERHPFSNVMTCFVHPSIEERTSWIVGELAYNNHKYSQANDANKANGYMCECGYPEANHPEECFE